MSDFRLKVFQSVAKNLSFTKASQELFVSPAGYNQAYPGAGGHLSDEAFRPAGK